MSAQFQIRVEPDGLILRSTKLYNGAETVVACAVSLLIWGFVMYQFVSWPFAMAAALFGAWSAYRVTRRRRTAELRATSLEFQTSRRRWPFGPAVSIPRANVRLLEYRDTDSSDDSLARPCGLYACIDIGDKCLLPDIDRQQTAAALKAISERFPEMRGTG